MTLQEFLTTANADDALALDEALVHTVTTYRKIGANEARQFFSLMGALDFIEQNQTNTNVVEVIEGVPTTIGQLCKAILGTINDAGQFATDPATQDGLLNRSASSLIGLPQHLIDAFFARSETVEHPFANISLDQVKAVRHPALWSLCDHGDTDYIVSQSQSDLFTFVATFSRPNSSYSIRLKWREDEQSNWKTYSSDIVMRGHETELLVSQQIKRLGVFSAARHFQFEYLANDSQVLSDVRVAI